MSAKASRTVLKTSRGGDLPAESAWRLVAVSNLTKRINANNGPIGQRLI
jgi:hypothetical protein